MAGSNHQIKFLNFREEFPFFCFENQEIVLDINGLFIRYTFNLANQYWFYPSLFIPRNRFFLSDQEILPRLPSLVFHIGMIELLSYWKAACPPKVVVKPFYLNEKQCGWWKNLYYQGLGEFRWLNGITIEEDELLSFEFTTGEGPLLHDYPLNDSVIIPVGGGKDSAVTLELLGNMPGAMPLILNPRGASIEMIRAKGFTENDFFEIQRKLDSEILNLNQQGFLNGHTPFSALLGFITLLASAMTGKKNIVLSNESSASEPTIPGTNINHQYSKSFEFEGRFRTYISEWLHPDMNYFSFLRPLNELQIASVFSGTVRYHTIFKSCNAGSKTDTWCGQCSKCLFTWIILSPFLPEKNLVSIFGKNLWEDHELLSYFDQLSGISGEKPFDCVGTTSEIRAALARVIRNRNGQNLPFLLKHFRNSSICNQNDSAMFDEILREYDKKNFLPASFNELLSNQFYGRISS